MADPLTADPKLHPDGSPFGYRVANERLADLALEYVRYRNADGNIPQPYLDLVSIISELQSYRRFSHG